MPRSDLDPAAIDVERAAAGLGDRVHRTPTFSSRTLGRIAGVPVSLKAELFQRTGSFKPRGAFTRLDALTAAERRQGVVTVSAGNHAAALAFTAAEAEIDRLVLMTRGASELKAAAARDYGATLDREAEDPAALFSRLDELRGDRVLVHPFDDPLVIAGQGTVGVELPGTAPRSSWSSSPWAESGSWPASRPRRRRTGPRRVSWPSSPKGRPLSAKAPAAGRPVPVAPYSVADGLNAPFAGGLPLAVCRAFGVEHTTVRWEGDRRLSFRSCMSAPSSPPSRPGPPESPRCSPGRSTYPMSQKRGRCRFRRHVEPEIASGILRFDEGRHPSGLRPGHYAARAATRFRLAPMKLDLHVEIRSECHPFYTGKQKLLDTGGRVERFQRRLEGATRSS